MNDSIATRISRYITASAITLLVAASAAAQVTTLPVKNIRNRQYYYIKVEKGATVYSITHQLGITHADLVKYNPAVADGLKAGQTLYFPVDEYGNGYGASTTTTMHVVKKGETLFSLAGKYGVPSEAITALNPGSENGIKIGQTLVIPGGDAVVKPPVAIDIVPEVPSQPTPVNAPVKVEDPDVTITESTEGPELNIAVCLPFMLGEEALNKSAVYATDFYKGLLLGLDSLHAAYGSPKIHLTAIDTDNPEQPFNALTKNAETLKNAHIIIAPETIDRLEALGKYGKENGVYVLNTFMSRDTTYLDNPYMLQSNAAQADMYDKAIDYLVSNLDGATPIFLDNEKGNKDKQTFIDAVMERLANQGINYRLLKYNGTMTSSAILDKLPVDADPNGINYVFIPMSGSLAEFHKFATALIRYRTEAAEAQTPGRVRLFGYPEYTRFSGDALEKLKKLNTTFYSRFYNDPAEITGIRNSYTARYGTELPEGVPNQALYGLDVAHWLLALAAGGDVTPENIENANITNGAQSAYRFERKGEGGFINNTIFIVTLDEFNPVQIKIL